MSTKGSALTLQDFEHLPFPRSKEFRIYICVIPGQGADNHGLVYVGSATGVNGPKQQVAQRLSPKILETEPESLLVQTLRGRGDGQGPLDTLPLPPDALLGEHVFHDVFGSWRPELQYTKSQWADLSGPGQQWWAGLNKAPPLKICALQLSPFSIQLSRAQYIKRQSMRRAAMREALNPEARKA